MTSVPEIISYHSADFELAVDAKLLSESFAKFVGAAWEHVTGYEYSQCRHIDVLVRHLEGVERGDITRLLANIPPGIFKTTVVSVLFPAWVWTRDQSLAFLSIRTIPALQQKRASNAENYFVPNGINGCSQRSS